MNTNKDFEFLSDLFQNQDRKLAALADKLESQHKEMLISLHAIENKVTQDLNILRSKVDNTDRTIMFGKWIMFTSFSGVIGILTFFKDLFGPFQHK